jgi:hypothetical protein
MVAVGRKPAVHFGGATTFGAPALLSDAKDPGVARDETLRSARHDGEGGVP